MKYQICNWGGGGGGGGGGTHEHEGGGRNEGTVKKERKIEGLMLLRSESSDMF